MTPERLKARQDILKEANSWRLYLNPQASLLRMKHIDKAVAIVRNNKIVDPELLVQAGFRGSHRR